VRTHCCSLLHGAQDVQYHVISKIYTSSLFNKSAGTLLHQVTKCSHNVKIQNSFLIVSLEETNFKSQNGGSNDCTDTSYMQLYMYLYMRRWNY